MTGAARLKGYEGLPDDLICAMCQTPVVVHPGADLWLCWHLLASERWTAIFMKGLNL